MLAAIVTAALACGLVYLIFLRGQNGLERMDLTAEAQVLRAYERMVPAAEALDADELFRFTTENDRGALVSGGRILRTQADARDRTRESFAGLASLKYTFTERHVTLLSSNAALLIVAGTSHAKTTDGRELSVPFVQSVVFTREKGDWRVLHTHQSSPAR